MIKIIRSKIIIIFVYSRKKDFPVAVVKIFKIKNKCCKWWEKYFRVRGWSGIKEYSDGLLYLERMFRKCEHLN